MLPLIDIRYSSKDRTASEYYEMFGSLSAGSVLDSVLFEIETLADNAMQAAAAYQSDLQGCRLTCMFRRTQHWYLNEGGYDSMSIWAKVATAIRGGVSEAGEAIVDHQVLRILDQEIRDADNELGKSKEALTGIIAKRKLADKKVASLKSSLTEYEGYAMQALDKGDDDAGYRNRRKNCRSRD